MTKHLNDETLKPHLTIDDSTFDVCPEIVDRSTLLGTAKIVREPKRKTKVRVAKNKMPVKRTSKLERATRILFDLEDACEPEKPLNIDFDLYQMEDY